LEKKVYKLKPFCLLLVSENTFEKDFYSGNKYIMIGEVMAKEPRYGEWAFLAGVLLAVVLGLVEGAGYSLPGYVLTVVVLLGLVVGLMNITAKEASPFLLATLVLMATSSAGLEKLPYIGNYLEPVLAYVAIFVAPAALVVALKAVKEMAASK